MHTRPDGTACTRTHCIPARRNLKPHHEGMPMPRRRAKARLKAVVVGVVTRKTAGKHAKGGAPFGLIGFGSEEERKSMAKLARRRLRLGHTTPIEAFEKLSQDPSVPLFVGLNMAAVRRKEIVCGRLYANRIT